MKTKILLVISLLLAGCGGSRTPAAVQPNTDTDALLEFQNEITVSYLRNHLSALAADSMEGRETGTRGQKMAAGYLAEEYRRLGLKPAGEGGSYYQNFELAANRRDSTVFTTHELVDGEQQLRERSVASAEKTANYIRLFGGADTLSGEIVFAGFGINDTTNGVAHLEGVDLKDKWVLVFQDIPHVVGGDTLINPSFDSRYRFGQVISRMGAEGLLIIPSTSIDEFQEEAKQARYSYGKAAGMRLKYRPGNSGFPQGYSLINPALAAQILGLKKGAEELSQIRAGLVENITDFKPEPTGATLTQIPYSTEVEVETENVLALYEGADPELKDEFIVITSHYDHVGIGRPDSTGDRIYNGADDDGSGTVGLLNIARALAKARDNGVATRRSVLFLNVSGEEKGLLGSRYYSDHPVVPIEKTVANINVDMIGRIDKTHKEKGQEEYAYIIGGKIISSQLDSLLRVANRKAANIDLDDRYNDLADPNQFYRRSDHWNFGRLGIPFVFFFTGVHEDYHRPSDEVEKIRFDKLAKITRTMYATTVMVANTDNPPEVDNQEFIEITKNN